MCCSQCFGAMSEPVSRISPRGNVGQVGVFSLIVQASSKLLYCLRTGLGSKSVDVGVRELDLLMSVTWKVDW